MARKPVVAALFGRSPFKPLQAHMREALVCAREVPGLFEALCAGDRERLVATKERIFESENRADKIKNELRLHLPKSLFMPVDRRDLLNVLQMQDSIADTAQDIAGLLVERDFEVPEGLQEPLLALCRRCIDVCEIAMEVIESLDELLTMGFRGKRVDQVEKMLDALSDAETETDDLGLELTRRLFRAEDEMKPVSVMLWYRQIEWIGDLADYAEKVGNQLRLMIAR